MNRTASKDKSKNYPLQRISIAKQRGKAACILGTLVKNRIDEKRGCHLWMSPHALLSCQKCTLNYEDSNCNLQTILLTFDYPPFHSFSSLDFIHFLQKYFDLISNISRRWYIVGKVVNSEYNLKILFQLWHSRTVLFLYDERCGTIWNLFSREINIKCKNFTFPLLRW